MVSTLKTHFDIQLKRKERLNHIRGVFSFTLQPGAQFSSEDIAYGSASEVGLAGYAALITIVANHLGRQTFN